MTDPLMNPIARRLVGALRLPIPLPVALRRDDGPLRERFLDGEAVVIGAAPSAECRDAIAAALGPTGAAVHEAGGAPSTARALVFDATGVAGVAQLRALLDFFQPLVRRLATSGRAVVVARPVDGAPSADRAAVRGALEGFVRSLAKELGRTGATANLVRVAPGAEDRLAPVLHFLLSPRSAFITAQPLSVTARARAATGVPSTRPLEKRVALVTGAARGIGEVTARLLAREGAHVLCVDHPEGGAPATEVARAIGGTALLADVTDASTPARVAEVLRGLGGVDVVVHNAGITRDKTLARMSAAQWDAVLGVNLDAALRLQAELDRLLRDEGRIVCLSSVAGLAGNVGQTAYAASKAGFAAWARALADRLAERGVTANAVAPGFIETRLTAAMPFAVREGARRLAALGQGGLPEDVANAILFLASPGAHGITGTTLRVCGGALVGA